MTTSVFMKAGALLAAALVAKAGHAAWRGRQSRGPGSDADSQARSSDASAPRHGVAKPAEAYSTHAIQHDRSVTDPV